MKIMGQPIPWSMTYNLVSLITLKRILNIKSEQSALGHDRALYRLNVTHEIVYIYTIHTHR